MANEQDINDLTLLYLERLKDIKEGRVTPIPLGHHLDPVIQSIAEVASALDSIKSEAKDLTTAFEDERRKLLEQDWIKSHYASIFDKLKGIKTINELAYTFISELAQAVNAQTAVFLADTSTISDKQITAHDSITVVATYGKAQPKNPVTFKIGEGIVGQCCKDKKSKYIANPPADYASIESALGKTKAGIAAIIPFILEDQSVGALELAAFEPFDDSKKALIELVCASIGINIGSLASAANNERLLAEIAKSNNSLEAQKMALDASAIVAETDPAGRITYVNNKFLEISKYSKEEVMGQDHRILNSKHHPKEFFVGLWAKISRGKIWNNEVCNKAKDGSLYWVDTTVFPIKDKNGQLEKFVAIRFDITSRKQAEDQLLAASTSLISQKQALDSAAIVAETDSRGRITYVNEKFIELSKYSREQLIGQDHRILNSGHHPKEFFMDLWITIATGNVWHGEVKNKAADGSYYWVDTTVYPAKDEHGKIQKYVAIRFDITDRKTAEEKLKIATEQATAAAKVKSDFLATISHEIRTPLNGIIGFASILREQTLTPEQAQASEYISICGNHLRVLVNDFLDFSKIEAGKLDIDPRPFNLRQLIELSGYMTEAQIAKNNLAFKIDIAHDVPEDLISDSTRIKQIIINLVSNAAKFTERGHINVSARVAGMKGNIYDLEFCVEDTGIGIPTSTLGKLFKAFTQADSSTSRKYGGTGLGLAISKNLAELLGGKMWVESKEGIGSRFYFTIKATRAEKQALAIETNVKNTVRPELGSTHPLKILIADDNKVNQMLVNSLLNKLGYKGDVAVNGKEAVAMFSKNHYDLILMDMQMPEMDGPTATEEIRKLNGASPLLQIIAVTANTQAEDKERCLKSGMNNFLTKPIRIEDLTDAILTSIENLSKKVA